MFNAAVILLDPAVEIGIVTMFHVGAQDFPNRPWIPIMAVRGDLLRNFFCHGETFSEEALCGGHVPCRTQHRIHQMAIPIARSLEIAPLAFYLPVGLIHLPTSADFALALATQLLC